MQSIGSLYYKLCETTTINIQYDILYILVERIKLLGRQKTETFRDILELLSEFDPFLEEYLKVYRNAGKGNPSYLSANICETFIDLIVQYVLCAILEEIKESK